MLSSIIVVHLVLALFNFMASIVQGIASFGDAVLLQVLWFIVCSAFPDPFNQTPLGNVPVKVVALLMYARVVFSAPYMAYLCLQSGGLFSKSMCLWMAIPSTTTAIIGVYVFSKADGGSLTLFLGISSLIFAIIFTAILAFRYYKRRVARQRMAAATAAAATNTSTAMMMPSPSHLNATAAASNGTSSGTPRRASAATNVTVIDEFDMVADQLAASRNASFSGVPPGLSGAPESASEDDDMRTVMSTMTGEVFTRREARTPVINESESGPNPVPLTYERLSPTETMTFTRVQINRNLDENGKIKLVTKVAAGVAAAGSGIMGSLTGVGAPPQVVFVLWFEVPQYIIRVNFAVQSIPSAVFRFCIAIYKPLFSWAMVPYLINAVLSGYVGVFVGNKLGKLLGPNAFNVFVLMILLLSSLLMVTENPYLLTLFTLTAFVVSGLATWYERKTLIPKLEQQRAAEREVYANRPTMVMGADRTNTTTGTASGAESAPAAAPSHDASCSGEPRPQSGQKPSTPQAPPRTPASVSHVASITSKAERPLNKSTSLTTVDSFTSAGTGRRVRNADKFRPPSLFTTPKQSPLPQRQPAPDTRTAPVVVPPTAALQTEDKTRAGDDDELI